MSTLPKCQNLQKLKDVFKTYFLSLIIVLPDVKNYTTVDPKQWVDSRSDLGNRVKHMK